ncbi:uncharacterized protein LOC125048731 [Pieris napi]|uniref:Regulatory protein zeste n=1 Tax=Pieris macdunnoughi TaxID=345717 RepID=A0A821T1N3_9NEOP|nr:uncharacterized protein LOC125048731 [Pieris napi]CAF4864207.1 unnamed protein product [Pieris macdunnoughi]
MNSALSRSRVSAEQLDLLLTFMEEHRDFAAGKQSIYSRFSASKLWRLLAERLNAAAADTGGARKSPDKWCRYWADVKYKARKKCAAGGALGDLSSAEERLQNILSCKNDLNAVSGGAAASDEERKALDEDMCSEGSAPLATDELLAEAAMRTALAAEKQAEAVVHAVDLLRDLVTLLRERPPAPPPATHDHLAMQHQHHHPL